MFGVQWSVVRVADRRDDRRITSPRELTQDAEELFGSLTVLPSGEATLALTHFDPAVPAPDSGRYYQILVDDDAVLRSPSLVGESLAMPAGGSRAQRASTHVAGPKEPGRC